MAAEGLADLTAAAKFLGGVCTKTVRNLIKRQQLTVRRVGRRVIVPVAALRLLAVWAGP